MKRPGSDRAIGSVTAPVVDADAPDGASSEPPPRRPPAERSPRRHAIQQLLWLAAAAAILLVAALSNVDAGPARSSRIVLGGVDVPLPFRCMFRTVTGIPCPGCGVSRCVVSLAHGQLSSAWNFNPGGIVFFGLVLAQFPYRSWQLWRLARGQTPTTYPRIAWWAVALLVSALLAQWLVRLALAGPAAG